MNLSQISKLPRKGEEYAPNHALWIGGENWTRNLQNASITYAADNGGSGCQFAIRGDLRDYDNAPVTLWLGYGDEIVPYFVGNLQRPQYFNRMDYTATNAFGRYKLMADQLLRTDKNFFGMSLRDALAYLINRAGYRRGEVEVRGGGEYTIEDDELYVWNNTLGEIAASLLEKAQYIGMDMPEGKRLFIKRPRPGVHGVAKEHYQPSEYTVDAFELTPRTEVSYREVVVQLVNKEGEQVGLYGQEIGNTGRFSIPPYRVYPVTDFLGTPLQAQQEAADTARYLRSGDWGFSFTIPLNPTLGLYDSISVTNAHRGRSFVYKCVLSADIGVEYTPATRDTPGVATMTLGGDALQIGEEEEVYDGTR